MRALRRFLLWYALLTKRLLRRPAFWCLLLCVPLLAGAMAAVAKQESGIVSVALYCPAADGPIRRSADRLLDADSLVRCTEYESEAAAREAVQRAAVDAAWIFRDNAVDELERFAAHRGTRGTVVVVEREDNVFLRLAREQLAAALYPEASRALFRGYLIEYMDVPEDSPDELFEHYYSTQIEDAPIIVFSHLDGSPARNDSYLVAPVRGLLALLLILTGLGSAMHYYADERRETFLRLRAPLRRFLPFLVHFTALFPVGIAALVALRAAGLLGAWPRELGVMLLYCAAAAAFCELLRRLCRSQARLGALIPVLLAVMLALCPVFFDWNRLEPLRRLLPPYYYLNAIHSGSFVWQLAAFACAAAALGALLPDTTTPGT